VSTPAYLLTATFLPLIPERRAYIMNIGLSELLVIILNLALLLVVPVVVILSAVFLFRRIRDLEARVAKLEDGKEK
jgi:hypothetical protein